MNKTLKKHTPLFILNVYRQFRMNKRLKQYQGDQVFCTICASTFREFTAFGPRKRKNARCPRCGSLERHRLIWKYLHEKTDLMTVKTKTRLLHFAPEQVFYDAFSKNPNIDYVPCDLSPEGYRFKGSVKITKVDIVDIPFEDNSFDVVLCNHVFEHIPDDARAMSEVFRVLKKGGWAILQVPIDYSRNVTYEDFTITSPEGREKAFGQYDHLRYYGKDYPERLRKVGFEVLEDDFIKTFTPEEQFRFGLLDYEYLYYCTK